MYRLILFTCFFIALPFERQDQFSLKTLFCLSLLVMTAVDSEVGDLGNQLSKKCLIKFQFIKNNALKILLHRSFIVRLTSLFSFVTLQSVLIKADWRRTLSPPLIFNKCFTLVSGLEGLTILYIYPFLMIVLPSL